MINKLKSYMKEHQLSQRQVSAQLDVSPSVINQYLKGTYPGDIKNLESNIQALLQRVEEKVLDRHTFDYVSTPKSKRALDVIRYAQVENDISLITGAAGLGKTQTLKEYVRQEKNVIFIETEPTYTAKVLLREICLRLNLSITERVARANGYTGNMRDIPRDTAIAIYFKDYWDGKLMNYIKNHVAFHLYDCSINSGYSRAIKLLQRAVGVTEDGLIGANTINAISRYSEKELVLRFNIVRMHFYGTLKTFSTFGIGWRNRLLKLSDINWELEADKYE